MLYKLLPKDLIQNMYIFQFLYQSQEVLEHIMLMGDVGTGDVWTGDAVHDSLFFVMVWSDNTW